MSYHISIFVRFDPCSLREHEFKCDDFGIGALARVETCPKCGTWRYQPRAEQAYIGINRETSCWGQA